MANTEYTLKAAVCLTQLTTVDWYAGKCNHGTCLRLVRGSVEEKNWIHGKQATEINHIQEPPISIPTALHTLFMCLLII